MITVRSNIVKAKGTGVVNILPDEYRIIRELILRASEADGRSDFNVCYKGRDYNLNVCGTVLRECRDACGDGFHTPCEYMETTVVSVEFYECRDSEDRIVPTDFDHRKIN